MTLATRSLAGFETCCVLEASGDNDWEEQRGLVGGSQCKPVGKSVAAESVRVCSASLSPLRLVPDPLFPAHVSCESGAGWPQDLKGVREYHGMGEAGPGHLGVSGREQGGRLVQSEGLVPGSWGWTEGVAAGEGL